jgi:outer membrane protein assembly factor BamB
MKIQNEKTIAIALILTVTMIISMIALPVANAHDPPRIYATYPRIHVAPDPVGVGQEVIIVGMMNWALPGANIANEIRFRNLAITITAPDGTTHVQQWELAPDSGGSAFMSYTPVQPGIHTILFEHRGQNGIGTIYDWGGVQDGNIWLPSNVTTTFTVLEEPVGTPLIVPLPTEYWTRPIEGQNTEWSAISSNWLAGAAVDNRWQKDGAAPRTPHVLWTKQIELGGIVGGTTINDQTFYSGFSYETRFTNPIVISGILYYQAPLGHAGSGGGYFAVDLRTGEEIWSSNDINPTKGQLFYFESPNQHGTVGGILYQVVGSTWRAYDAFSGKAVFNLTGVPSGTEVYDTTSRLDWSGPTVEEQTPLVRAGDIVRYQLQYAHRQLRLWSVAKAVGQAELLYFAEGWRPNNKNINASDAFLWNVTIPDLPGSSAPAIVGVIPGDLILGRSSDVTLTSLPRQIQPDPWTMWALNLNPDRGPIGSLLWIRDYPALPGNKTIMLAHQPLDPVNRVWLMTEFETGDRYGYNIDNGERLWGPIGANDIRSMQLYSSRQGFPAYGILYVSGYGGEIFAYSTLNGTLLWKFNDTDTTRYRSGIPWGLQPLHISAVADGVVYAFAGEHSPNTPLYKGNRHFAIDAFTGEEIWSMYGWSASGLGTTLAPIAIADGILIYLNAYDGKIYAIGKGPSAITVSIQNDVTTYGNKVLVRGSVMDIASGIKQHEQDARFPNGVPAVSDESMSAWMEYIYMQKPRPTEVNGVEIVLSVLDPNNNYYEIGRTIADADGFFKLMFEPEVQGEFTVIATFEGSEAYYGSHAKTALFIEEATQPIEPTPALESMADLYFLPVSIGLLVAIVLVGAVIMLMLRKRP